MKKIKWILLGLSILSIIISIILFIDYKKDYDKNGDEPTINSIYNKRWFKVNTQVYNNGDVIISENYLEGYIMLTEEIIKYCTSDGCEEHEYVYENDIIDVPLDKFIYHGKYKLKYDKDNLDFILADGDEVYNVIYHFETAKG